MTKLSSKICFILINLLISSGLSVFADTPKNSEKKTAEYFQKIKQDPLLLYSFLYTFPKGGDLHNHFAGSPFAENLIKYGKNDNFCVNTKTFMLSAAPQCVDSVPLANAGANHAFHRSIVNSWSMNEFVPSNTESGGAHFFATFLKFNPIVFRHPAEVLTEIVARAGAEHINYLELMVNAGDLGATEANTLSSQRALVLSNSINENNFAKARDQLLQQPEFDQAVKQILTKLDTVESAMRKQLRCDTVSPDPGCQVKIRYQYFALRELTPAQVFNQLLTGFELAKQDPRFVAVNMVMAEDGPTALKDYTLHMQMVNFLHSLYPGVHISLHAGELAPTSTPPEDLKSHIRQAVETAHAERIGHGVDIAFEKNAKQLLEEMAAKKILVEINLTSNLAILGVAGEQHPLALYRRFNVPVALSTDDEGVLRTDLTHEYQRAALTYHLDYLTLKNLSRNSLTYSFLPGQSLWNSSDCQKELSRYNISSPLTLGCQQFLAKNEKARLQWQLEKEFQQFEKGA